MEAAGFSEMSVSTNQNTLPHVLEERDHNSIIGFFKMSSWSPVIKYFLEYM
jgi:hypothetical protein